MSAWLVFPKNLRQAAIAGKAVDPRTSLGVPGAVVDITAMPTSFAKWLSLRRLSYGDAWSTLPSRPDRTVTAADGTFRLLDLPDGSYTITITPPDGGKCFGETKHDFTVARDAQGMINATPAQISLHPTALEGSVIDNQPTDDGSPAPISMACIEVNGTLERTYTNASGGFYLTDVQPGARTFTISAPGYKSLTVSVTVIKGEITEMGSFVMSALSTQ